jgi:hypothetical protein
MNRGVSGLEDLEQEARGVVARLLPQAEAAHVEVTCLVEIGRPYQKILESAAAAKVGVIVMATHGLTALCPVLRVRATASWLAKPAWVSMTRRCLREVSQRKDLRWPF